MAVQVEDERERRQDGDAERTPEADPVPRDAPHTSSRAHRAKPACPSRGQTTTLRLAAVTAPAIALS